MQAQTQSPLQSQPTGARGSQSAGGYDNSLKTIEMMTNQCRRFECHGRATHRRNMTKFEQKRLVIKRRSATTSIEELALFDESYSLAAHITHKKKLSSLNLAFKIELKKRW